MPAEEAVLNQFSTDPDEAFKEMIDAGVFYGRKKTKTHPRMKVFIYGNRSGIEIIDLSKTLIGLEKASTFLRGGIAEGKGLFLVVGTQPAAEDIVSLAQEFHLPYVRNRWIGGTLTNFKTIIARVEHLKKLKSDKEKGLLDKYTKKERLNIEREIARLEQLFGSLANLERLPDALLVIDSELHHAAVREARRLGIPVVALSSTDANPDMVDYMVVGNAAARKSINWFLEKISGVIREAEKEHKARPTPPAEEEKKG